jgi:3-hydroxyisobutyrate dehydrogenase-like beta-hydroxyacid dehydrogenase
VTEPRPVETVGIMGCGRMGRQMAAHLSANGWDVRVSDPSEDALQLAADQGASPSSPEELARTCDLLLLVVVDDDQVRQIFEAPNGVLAHARPGTTIGICASVHPRTCTELEARGSERDLTVVDVALAGGERGAEQASLTLLCGGSAAGLEVAQPAFAAFATTVIHVGAIGTGQVAKTANNVLMWAALRIDVEALRLAREFGVAPGVLRPILGAGTGANRPLTEWGLHRLRWPTKDLHVARAMADDVGLEVPLMEHLVELMEELDVEDLEDLR